MAEEQSNTLIVLFLIWGACVAPIALGILGVLLVTSIRGANRAKQQDELEKQLERNKVVELGIQAQQRIVAGQQDAGRMVTEAMAELSALQMKLASWERDARSAQRDKWLAQISQLSFANEVEVEIKFVYPLLLLLGYRDDEFAVRYKVPFQAGREQLQKEADWVVWRRNEISKRALMVIEAKAPAQALDALVQGQGRSYAFAMNAPVYVLTNGFDFQIFERGVENDKCAFRCSTKEIQNRWDELYKRIGVICELEPMVSP